MANRIYTLKVDKTLLSQAITQLEAARDNAADASISAVEFWSSATKWKNNLDNDELLTLHKRTFSTAANRYQKSVYDKETNTTNYVFDEDLYNQDNAAAEADATTWISRKKSAFQSAVNKFTYTGGDFVQIQSDLNKMIDGMNKISTALENMESKTYDMAEAEKGYIASELAEMKSLYDRYGVGDEFDMTADDIVSASLQLTTSEDGTSIATVDGTLVGAAGRINLSTAYTAAHRYVTSAAGSAVVAATYCSNMGLGMSDFETMMKKIVPETHAVNVYETDNGYFDLSSDQTVEDKIEENWEKTFNEPYTEENLLKRTQEIIEASGLTPEQIKALGGSIDASTGAAVIGSINPSVVSTLLTINDTNVEFTPGAGVPELYGTGDNAVAVPGYTPSATGITSASPQNIIETSVATISGDEIHPFTAQISLPSSKDVPKTIQTSIDVSTIDAQAEEIFYNRTPDQIAADRANALAAVDQAFSGQNVSEFREVLKQGGFEDVDIDAIMDNKEVAVTAYILASESKNLTDIANKLAVANGIENFDTSFDNGLDRMSLENGLSQSKLMSEVDDDVVEARNGVRNARSKYNNSAKKANEDIEDADKKRQEMEEIKKKIIDKSGEDTSKWDDDDVEAYNKAVDSYNKANKQANESYAEAMNDKNALTEAEKNLTETQEKTTQEYLDNFNEYSNQQDTNGAEAIPTSTDGDIVDINGNPESTLSTGDINIDSNGNVSISENVGKVETNVTVSNDVPDSRTLTDSMINLDSTSDTMSSVVNDTTSFANANSDSTLSSVVSDTTSFASANSGNTLTSVVNDTTSFANANSDGRSLTTDDLMSLFGDNEDLSNISNSQRSLESVDLSSIVSDDRTLPDLVTNDGNLGGDNFAELANVKGIDTNNGNGLVNFANNNTQNISDKVSEFQGNRVNGIGNMDLSSGLSSLQGDAAYSISSEDSSNETSTTKDVAGASVETKEVEKHTDGVLVEKDDSVLSEVSDDGRRLESVEID